LFFVFCFPPGPPPAKQKTMRVVGLGAFFLSAFFFSWVGDFRHTAEQKPSNPKLGFLFFLESIGVPGQERGKPKIPALENGKGPPPGKKAGNPETKKNCPPGNRKKTPRVGGKQYFRLKNRITPKKKWPGKNVRKKKLNLFTFSGPLIPNSKKMGRETQKKKKQWPRPPFSPAPLEANQKPQKTGAPPPPRGPQLGKKIIFR